MISCYFDKLNQWSFLMVRLRLRNRNQWMPDGQGVRRRRRKIKVMMLKWSTKMMLIQFQIKCRWKWGKQRGSRNRSRWGWRWRKKQQEEEENVTSCKVVPNLHFSRLSLSRQTAIRNQVKKPELTNRKQGKYTEDEDDTIEGVVIEMNQHVWLTFS